MHNYLWGRKPANFSQSATHERKSFSEIDNTYQLAKNNLAWARDELKKLGQEPKLMIYVNYEIHESHEK